jgi:hypothetical protein
VLLSPAVKGSAQPLPAPVTTDAGTIRADKVAPFFKGPGYSPYARQNHPTRVFWGECTCIHRSPLTPARPTRASVTAVFCVIAIVTAEIAALPAGWLARTTT